jgi:hypothetical protein
MCCETRAENDDRSRIGSGLLSTWTMPPKQFGILKQYRSNVDPEGSVYFLQESGIEAQFSFQDKFLACNGDVTGFRNCPGDLSPVVSACHSSLKAQVDFSFG